jgi:hypothetical protein
MLTCCLLLPLNLLVAQEPPRLRTDLPNGATVLAETFSGSKLMSVQLFASSRGVADTPQTHGYRHLLEHMIVKGVKGDLDMRLESKGVFLRAETYRDFMHVAIMGRAEQMDLALDAVKQILQPPHWTKEQLAKEAHVISEELALLPDSILFSNAMWRQAFGDAGVDPMGDSETIAGVTPERLEALHKAHFATPNLLLVVTGPLGVDEATRKAKAVLERLPPSTAAEPPPALEGKPGRVEVAGAFGEARGAIVHGVGSDETAWVLAAAFAISTLVDGATLTYTPSARGGLIIVGQTAENGGLGVKIDALTDGERVAYFESSKNVAHWWIAAQLSSPAAGGLLRGELMVQSRSKKPERLLEAIDAMTQEEFLRGFKAFDKDAAVIGVGVKR